jgi:hypothetical protein
MTPAVAHRPRLAWDGARVIVAALEAGQDAWLAQIVSDRLGPQLGPAVADSRRRLAADTDAFLTEAGMWRVRLDDLLGQRPELAPQVAELISQATAHLSAVRGPAR